MPYPSKFSTRRTQPYGRHVASINTYVNDPRNLPRCVGYWDADDLSTLFQDAPGTIPVVASGQPVARWTNKAVTGAILDVAQANAARVPTWLSPAQNGQGGVLFDAVDDTLDSVLGASQDVLRNKSGGTLVCVFNSGVTVPGIAPATSRFAMTPRTGGGAQRAGLTLSQPVATPFTRVGGRRLDADPFLVVLPEPALYVAGQFLLMIGVFKWWQAELFGFVSGANAANLIPFQTAGSSDNTAGTTGVRLGDNVSWLDGAILAAAVYDRELYAWERQALERWASRRWALAQTFGQSITQ